MMATTAYEEMQRGFAPDVKQAVVRLAPHFKARLMMMRQGESVAGLAKQVIASCFAGLSAEQEQLLTFALVMESLNFDGLAGKAGSIGGAVAPAFTREPTLTESVQSLQSRGASPETIRQFVDEQRLRYIQQVLATMSSLSKNFHDTAKSIISNLRA